MTAHTEGLQSDLSGISYDINGMNPFGVCAYVHETIISLLIVHWILHFMWLQPKPSLTFAYYVILVSFEMNDPF